jgi:hypothetical protein
MAGLAATEQSGWLTTILRPAGALDQAALGRLSEALDHLATSSDMVIIDLTATDVSSPRALARNLRTPARRFERAGRCLLVLGASPELIAELNHTLVPVATIAADAVPLQAGRQRLATP